jgi:hypothetical protein
VITPLSILRTGRADSTIAFAKEPDRGYRFRKERLRSNYLMISIGNMWTKEELKRIAIGYTVIQDE